MIIDCAICRDGRREEVDGGISDALDASRRRGAGFLWIGLHEPTAEEFSNVLTAHLAQITTRQNEDMRKISAWAAIIAVPTATAGIYGMNFDHMPELHWTIGYPLVLVLMAVICYIVFRRLRGSGWI